MDAFVPSMYRTPTRTRTLSTGFVGVSGGDIHTPSGSLVETQSLLSYFFSLDWSALTAEDLHGLVQTTLVLSLMFIDKYLSTFGASDYVHTDIRNETVLYQLKPPRTVCIVADTVKTCDDAYSVFTTPPAQMLKPHELNAAWPLELNAVHLCAQETDVDARVVAAAAENGTYTRMLRWPLLVQHMDLRQPENVARLLPLAPCSARAVDAWAIGWMLLEYIDTLWQMHTLAAASVPAALTDAAHAVVHTLMVTSARRDVQAARARICDALGV